MAKARWQHIFELFEESIEKSPEIREIFLDQACGDDEVLRRGVDELLEAHEAKVGSILDQPLVERPSGRAREPISAATSETKTVGEAARARPKLDPALPFETIGPYRLLRQIGQGGMSTVFMAAREDDAFRRAMVVKVVRSDMESASMLRRLRAERQILASLEHPYIARLYDGGSTDDGIPYFVMEHVEGLPIDVYCRNNQLSLSDRLKLFRKVCEAVHYAHQNLVVHRDIKPSNILVTTDGDPKLLDFGIAKVLNPGLGSPDIEVTAPWQRLMTPSFASPEQIRGDTITTVSDVYALGVLLYFLLTGRLPHSFDGRSLREIERLLTETEPLKPSIAVSTGGSRTRSEEKEAADTDETLAGGAPETLEPSAENESETGSWVPKKLLAGDIDAIVLKALRSVPSQRYGSVERFAEDIERFQTGFPVEARAGSRRYRAGKLLRRYRRAVAAAAVIAVLLGGAAVSMLIQAQRVAFERSKKAQVVSLILKIFDLSNAYVTPGAELTVREALERSLPVIEGSLRDQPEVRAEMLHTTGSMLRSIGVYGRAKEQLEEALEIRRRLLGDDHIDVAETSMALSAAHRELVELDKAELLAKRALEIGRDHFGSGHVNLVGPLIELISVYCYQEHYEAAEPLAEEVLELTGELPEEIPIKITTLEYLAQAHASRGEYSQALELNQQSLGLSRQQYGDLYPDQITTLSNIGVQLRRMDKFEEAKAAYTEAMAMQRQLFGEEHMDGNLLNNLAGVYFATEDYVNAEKFYREALEVVRRRSGEGDWKIFFLGLRIARSQTHQGEAAEAERQIRALMERGIVAEEHWIYAEATSMLGEAISAQGRCADAEPLLVDGLKGTIERNQRMRVRKDAFERLQTHLERCGKAEEIPSYEALL